MNITAILPEITLFTGALFILISDVFFGKKFKNYLFVSHFLSLIFCAISLSLIFNNFSQPELFFNQMFVSNYLICFSKSIAVVLLTFVILFSLNFVCSIPKISAEFLALLMIATVGAMFLISANDFLTFYLALELQGLSLYLLAALNKKSARSSEAGMKYFILGSVASGILLFGISMIYGFSGTTNFTTLATLYSGGQDLIPITVIFGFILVITAMFFKVSAAPFHMWAPDVYEGSATIVATFFATVAKFASLIVLIRLFSNIMITWNGMDKILIFVAMASLAVGSFGAIWQKNLKRLLAYSSIGHVGFILLGAASFDKMGFKSCVLYIVIYAILSLGSFGFLNLIKSYDEKKYDNEDDAENEKIFAISSLAGLSKTNPVMAFSLAVLMFSTAGIPPLAGFFSKFYVIMAALHGGFAIAAVLAVLFSVISAYYYLKIVKIMYFDESKAAMQIDDINNVKFIILVTAILNLVFILFLNQSLISIGNFLDFQ